MKQVTILKSVNSCIDKDLIVYTLNADGSPDTRSGIDLEKYIMDIHNLFNECWDYIPEEERTVIHKKMRELNL